MISKIFIYSNENHVSQSAKLATEEHLLNAGFQLVKSCSDADMIIVIGGDGTFLEAVHSCSFPDTPFLGINTGHLGFFQEMSVKQIPKLSMLLKKEDYKLQPLSTVEAIINTESESYKHEGLNEVLVRGASVYAIHLDISIGDRFIERFSGDGLLVATPSGSTAYNYSLGGSIVDPSLQLIQVTPIAPMNTTAYRAFTSSILLPHNLSLLLVPSMQGLKSHELNIYFDGMAVKYDGIKSVLIKYSPTNVNLVRFSDYDFWKKVKSKFL